MSGPAEPKTDVLEKNFNNNNINCLSRSNTFTSSSGSVGNGSGKSPRRKLPQIPPRAISVCSRDNIFSPACSDQRDRGDERIRARSVGREINLLNRNNGDVRRSRLESPGYFYSIDERPSLLETDSGCYPSYDAYGEETCVDSPSSSSSNSTTSHLLPKRNNSNFLWVDFAETDKAVTRRPKNHDRLSNPRKNSNRHSAPPGSLDHVSSIIPRNKSFSDNPPQLHHKTGSKNDPPTVIKRSTSDRFHTDKKGSKKTNISRSVEKSLFSSIALI